MKSSTCASVKAAATRHGAAAKYPALAPGIDDRGCADPVEIRDRQKEYPPDERHQQSHRVQRIAHVVAHELVDFPPNSPVCRARTAIQAPSTARGARNQAASRQRRSVASQIPSTTGTTAPVSFTSTRATHTAAAEPNVVLDEQEQGQSGEKHRRRIQLGQHALREEQRRDAQQRRPPEMPDAPRVSRVSSIASRNAASAPKADSASIAMRVDSG